ncbi:MAG: anthranilate synthase component I [Chthoniobacterales bacterium]
MASSFFPSLSKFKSDFSSNRISPVWTEVVADVETPTSAFAKLGNEPPAFLLESAEQNDLVGRLSFVGCGCQLKVVAHGHDVCFTNAAGKAVNYKSETDPLKELEILFSELRCGRHAELEGFWGGAVGYLAYDTIRWVEPTVGAAPSDSLGVPDLFFWVPEVILVFDHHRRSIKLVATVLPQDLGKNLSGGLAEVFSKITGQSGGTAEEVYTLAQKRIGEVQQRLSQAVSCPPLPTQFDGEMPDARSNTTREEYHGMVERGKEYIRAGDIFQFVPSQRFSAEFGGDALDLYRALRFINPSPYMFCLRCEPGFSIVGSSPEVHVRLTDRLVEIRPIAGTRKRGADATEDKALAEDLLADPKERAEHLMLVDLARNDVGRIADFASVEVTDFMTVEHYSHVMHIVSHVTGKLAGGRNAFDVMRATFPAGTVSGSPKVRAMQIINEVEKNKRCIYAGAVGYFRFDGDLDSCIALRTVVLKDGKAHVQAGGGVVADSTPEGEYQESVNKAKAALRAVGLAKTLK